MALIRANDQLGSGDAESKFKFIEIFMASVKNVVNGNIDFSKNVLFPGVDVIFSTANAQKAVKHNLGRIPRGYLVIGQTANFNVYNGTAPWTKDLIYLRASAVGTAKIVFV
jgi:hypothetical protein